jgi:excisionase family DNA binding protein
MCYTGSMCVTYAPKDFLSVMQAARELRVSKWTIYRWVDQKIIVGVEVAGRLCITKDEVERVKTARAPAEAEALPTIG